MKMSILVLLIVGISGAMATGRWYSFGLGRY
uniref:SAGE_M_79 n=2 Tax=Drosophila pseudoobscura TaxID=7237 RepID=B3TQE2_9MUSC|nr:SAGE_M_79 [Drosophila pseudoobscura]